MKQALVFYMGDMPHHASEYDDFLLAGQRNCLIGLLTRRNSIVHFNSRYHAFIMQLKANGFHKIFRIPKTALPIK